MNGYERQLNNATLKHCTEFTNCAAYLISSHPTYIQKTLHSPTESIISPPPPHLVLGLHHIVPLCPETRHMAIHIHGRLIPDPLQHAVDGDEAARAAHPGRAVGHHRPGVRGVQGLDAPQEEQEGGRVVRDAVVRPRDELELTDFAAFQGVRLWGSGSHNFKHT